MYRYRPSLTDTGGRAVFIGTPKKENPNLKRLEKICDTDDDYAKFYFTTSDNPHISPDEIAKAQEELDYDTFQQEYLAQYIENQGSLFKFEAVVDVFTNTITKDDNKYLIVDIADDGSDKTVFSLWEGLEEILREEYERLNTESIIMKVREMAKTYQIPYSHILVDAIGVGSAVATNSMLDGIIGFKSSFSAIKTEKNIVQVTNVNTINKSIPLITEYKNLRSQCVFKLAEIINNHKIASRVTGKFKEAIIEEIPNYQDVSKGDGKLMATQKEDIKIAIGRSPDHSDTWIMRMYFVIMEKMIPEQTAEQLRAIEVQNTTFEKNYHRQTLI